MRITQLTKAILPLGAAFALSACAAEEEETTYEPAVEDISDGELQVAPQDPDAVPVDLPETPMTPVSEVEAEEEEMAE